MPLIYSRAAILSRRILIIRANVVVIVIDRGEEKLRSANRNFIHVRISSHKEIYLCVVPVKREGATRGQFNSETKIYNVPFNRKDFGFVPKKKIDFPPPPAD